MWKLCLSKNFYTRKLGEVTAFYAVYFFDFIISFLPVEPDFSSSGKINFKEIFIHFLKLIFSLKENTLFSSIVKWGYSDNFKHVYFFSTKRFRAHKNTSQLEVYTRVKNCFLSCLVLTYFCFVNWFSLVMCFCALKIFL